MHPRCEGVQRQTVGSRFINVKEPYEQRKLFWGDLALRRPLLSVETAGMQERCSFTVVSSSVSMLALPSVTF
jgi:hypothetical protein